MQLTDVFCYALLSITISSVCARTEINHDLQNTKSNRKLRRETNVFIDSLPAERVYHKPKYIYRRLSKHRYGHPIPYPQYGPPRSYGPINPTRKPGKKYNAKLSSKYREHQKTSYKPRFRNSHSKKVAKPVYASPIKRKKPQRAMYNPLLSIGFAEPPKNHEDNGLKQALEYDSFSNSALSGKSTNHGYGEPPVDSYGAPIEPNLHDLASPTIQTYTPTAEESQNHFDIWQNRQKYKKKPIPEPEDAEFESVVFITPVPSVPEQNEEQNLKSYSDIYNYRLEMDKKQTNPSYVNHVKVMNRPWKGHKFSSKIEDSYHENTGEDVIVGGKYAEPPARHIPKHQADSQIFRDDDFKDVSSATNSPYMNYKNSNVAFSPQNLNDAFSIVD